MRNWLISGFTIIILLIGFLVYSHISFKNSIVYVNSNKLLNEYKGMIEAREDFENKANKWQAEIDTMQFRLKESIMDYEKRTATMSSSEKKRAEELLQSKKKEYEKHRKVLEKKARKEDEKMTAEIVAEVNTFLKEYCKKQGYTLVLGVTENGNIVYAKDKLNITEEVIIAINQNYRNEN